MSDEEGTDKEGFSGLRMGSAYSIITLAVQKAVAISIFSG